MQKPPVETFGKSETICRRFFYFFLSSSEGCLSCWRGLRIRLEKCYEPGLLRHLPQFPLQFFALLLEANLLMKDG